ncbi:acetaldehyde dehydrogenase (acetylating) [Arthrobacter sp. MYb227]|uniref:acetaldehyde dehydrogenase (acetylating) n=1 Tax=Arthrobacter sp. MYb227 TaxID=1848601 RepID=UPI000CFDF516|nr:acetaldehyde dehydrogenase (acetylating) [Arthrobacter sp. MYb227]PQZ94609.1 acetaldehyde dehydrogenase (acetylating) [Arthrobacter sp. MYb227]
MEEQTRWPVAIIGSGNIGTDLMIKVIRGSTRLEMGAMVGIDPESDGLRRAASFGVPTTAEGIEGLLKLPNFKDIKVVFDATSASAHRANWELLKDTGVRVLDLTPAAIGLSCIPVVNMEDHLEETNLNMVTCGGQATVPMVAAISAVAPVRYAEIVSSVSARSAGPGTRANIDEFTETTSEALVQVGGAAEGKAIMILNPAEPPMLMRNTVYALVEGEQDHSALEASIGKMVSKVQEYVPGYQLKQAVQFETFGAENPLYLPGSGEFRGTRITVMLEVTGAAHYLPAYAGNLDIMTSAAMAVAERWAAHDGLKNPKTEATLQEVGA